MDTIDVSNLNRQFLFRLQDVGKSKSVVAAERVMERVEGVQVKAHFGRIEEKPSEFYQAFHVIVLGLDSVEARSWINSLLCSFLEYDDEGNLELSTVKPMVDGGTEGFKGHTRVILPGITPCFNCTLWLFPPQTTFPLCTLAETPRSPVHCIEYAHLIQWGNERPGDVFDADNPEHMKWIHEKAMERANVYGIEGVTYTLAQGVVKNIVPAIASTNAIVAASCTLEVLKIVTLCSTGMNNYMMYVGSNGVYTHTVEYERDPECIVCSMGVPLHCSKDATLQQVMESLLALPSLKGKLSAPSISYGSQNLYMRGPLEEFTRPNLSKTMVELVGSKGGILAVNDKKLAGVLRVRLSYRDPKDPVPMSDL
eukprot:scaffold363_cov331-Pavlova_lutheri.AAC.23